MNKLILVFLVLLVFVTMSAGQSSSETEVESAIKIGLAGKLGDLFVACDVGAGFLQEVAIGSTSGNTGTVPTGKYHIQLSTNLGMIAMAASQAKQKYKPYGRSDVRDKFLKPAVYVDIFPSDPVETKNALGVVLQLGVTPRLSHVVLKSSAKDGTAAQPENLVVTPVPWTRGGSSVESTKGEATFAFDAVTAMPPGNFNIIVVTEAGERKCKVNQGSRKKLGLDKGN